MIRPHDGGHCGPAASRNIFRSTAVQNPAGPLHRTKATQKFPPPALRRRRNGRPLLTRQEVLGWSLRRWTPRSWPPNRPMSSGAAGLCPGSLLGSPGHPPTPGPARGLFRGSLAFCPQAPDTPGCSNGLPTRSGSINQGAARISCRWGVGVRRHVQGQQEEPLKEPHADFLLLLKGVTTDVMAYTSKWGLLQATNLLKQQSLNKAWF